MFKTVIFLAIAVFAAHTLPVYQPRNNATTSLHQPNHTNCTRDEQRKNNATVACFYDDPTIEEADQINFLKYMRHVLAMEEAKFIRKQFLTKYPTSFFLFELIDLKLKNLWTVENDIDYVDNVNDYIFQ